MRSTRRVIKRNKDPMSARELRLRSGEREPKLGNANAQFVFPTSAVDLVSPNLTSRLGLLSLTLDNYLSLVAFHIVSVCLFEIVPFWVMLPLVFNISVCREFLIFQKN